ncbi:caspase-8-like [Ptychodera flava]|uniref:caspase-8-like n=1 Tax=Ptychodera flava TaxID=63121 RepID=UPI00396A2D80
MKNNQRGIAVIINNQKFENHLFRHGSEEDKKRLTDLLKKLHFSVEVYTDQTIREIDDTMREVSRRDHSTNDCLVVCILSHGSGDKICGKDSSGGRGVEIRELTRWFTADRCRGLTGKPKIFFIQACKGHDRMPGIETDRMQPSDAITVPNLVPNEGDFLVGLSTVPGYVSYRSPSSGSWYIQTLVDMIEKYANNETLPAILEKVSNHVGQMMTDKPGFTQMPSHFSTLRKKLYLAF